MFKFSKQIKTTIDSRLQSLTKLFQNKGKSTYKSDKINNKHWKNNKTKQKQNKLIKASTINAVMNMNACNSNSFQNDDVREVGGHHVNNEEYSEYRSWQNTEFGDIFFKSFSSYNQPPGIEFTLVSYNILAQDLLDEHSYLYRNNQSYTLNWNYRLEKLTKEILTLKPHILCLQEVQINHLPQLIENFKFLEFDHIFKKKTGYRTDGCAIFYNKNIFELIGKKSVEYCQPRIEQLDRENVGLLAKLCIKNKPNECFVVATTHLLYNPRRQDVRLAQIQVLLAELDLFSFNGFYDKNKPKRIPIILTGDFNLKPYTAPFQLITLGKLEYSKLKRLTLKYPNIDDDNGLTGNLFLPSNLGITDNCQHLDVVSCNYYDEKSRLYHTEYNPNSPGEYTSNSTSNDPVSINSGLFSTGHLTHSLDLESAYDHIRNYNGKCGSTYQDEWITVDYIFYTKHFIPKVQPTCDGYLKLLSRYALPTVDQCHKMGMIPNDKLGSDHLALASKFYFQLSKQKL